MNWASTNLTSHKKYFNAYFVRRGLQAALIILLACIASYYFAVAEKFWMPVAAFFMLQNSIGNKLEESFQRLIAMLGAVLIGFFLAWVIENKNLLLCSLLILFSVTCYGSLKMRVYRNQLSVFMVAALTGILSALFSQADLDKRFHDILMGVVIGFIFNIIIIPARADVQFRKNMIPIFELFSLYLKSITELLYRRPHINFEIDTIKNQLEEIWEFFPDWVFNKGYIFSMQAGHRHFAIRVNQILEILFSMHGFARLPLDEAIIKALQPDIDHHVYLIQKLITAEITVLNLQQLTEGVEDLLESETALDSAFKNAVPLSLEGLEINSEYVVIAEFIFTLKELGRMFIVLAKALR